MNTNNLKSTIVTKSKEFAFCILTAIVIALPVRECRSELLGNQSPKDSSSSSAIADVGGCHIEVTSDDGSANVHAEEGRIKIATASAKITIKGGRILLNDAELSKLPAAVRKLEVKVADAQLTISADGVLIAKKQLNK